MDILKKVLEEIKPKKDDEILVEKRIKEFMQKIKIKDAKIVLGGSGAKGTWLKTTNDADIFVCFNFKKYSDKSDKLSDILEKQLKKKFKEIYRLHGSRDYFQIKKEGFTFEIVPIIDVKDSKKALNITDVSPLHAKFVRSAIKKKKKLDDEIRLMKQFCKANRVYGAESYINGFSGYMCELLVINYGGFLNLIKAAVKWDDKEVIDIKKFYKGKNVMLEMNKSKTVSPLVIIDPVQFDRNAAAALSFEKFSLFKERAKEFLKKKSEGFFEIKKFDKDKLKDYVIIEIKVLEGKEDVVGAKLIKVFDFMKKEILNHGFKIKDSGWEWDKKEIAYFYFKAEDIKKEYVVEGPNLKFEEHALNFKSKHKNCFVKSSRVYAKETREFVNAKELIKKLIFSEYTKERVKGIRVI